MPWNPRNELFDEQNFISSRCPLFGTSNQLAHSLQIMDVALDQGDRSDAAVCNQKEIFIEPVMWMKGNISEAQGKLFCPHCQKKIGSYAWFGMR